MHSSIYWPLFGGALEEISVTEAWRVEGRIYQETRDPENILIEERAAELAKAGYPLIVDDPAMDAEKMINAAKLNAKQALDQMLSEPVANVEGSTFDPRQRG